jgi:outer membrane protein OmpA-like peptidoglycan-associated protein
VDELTSQIAEKNQQIEGLQAEIRRLEELLRRLQPDDPIESYLTQVSDQRRKILETLQTQLKTDFPDLQVIISAEMDALRFKGDGLFNRGVSELSPDKRRVVETIAARLDEILPCYTLGQYSVWNANCNPVGAVIEAVQIEGHTDADGPDENNLNLSTARANQTFFAMVERAPKIVRHLNSRSQPVLSVAGYGEMRPVADNETAEGKATNRRIDLRIIMYTPRSLEDIDVIRADLQRGMSAGPSP